LGFWIVKILCTTLGETGGDAVSMSLNLGYLVGTAIFAAIFLSSVLCLRSWRPPISGRAFREQRSSGRHSSSRARSVRSWVTFSTSPSVPAAWR